MRSTTLTIVAALVVAGGLIGPPLARGARPASRPVIVRVERSGFHWADAGIGAAAALGVVLVLAAARGARR